MISIKTDNIIILRLEIGEKIIESLKDVMRKYDVQAGVVSGIGATDSFTCGVFNINTKEYKEMHYKGMYEILSLTGNLSTMNDEPYVHIHITVGDEACRCFGGHLIEAAISATAEIFIQVIDKKIQRVRDEKAGLNFLHI